MSSSGTLPSYSLRERTSGAMYAGVPTVDLGLECSIDDYTTKNKQNGLRIRLKTGQDYKN